MTMISPRSDVVYGIYRGLQSGTLVSSELSPLDVEKNYLDIYNRFVILFRMTNLGPIEKVAL